MSFKRQNKILWTALILGAFVFAGFIKFSEPAHAVRVSLKRIVFDNQKRSEILTLINNTAQPKTYRLGWRKYRMSETQSLQLIDEGEDSSDILWADDMIRFAPRRVTVPPGGSQQIRLLLRRPKDLQEAEYRAHLWIIGETKPENYTADTGSNQQAIRLSVQPAISLPIFVRNGNLSATANITNTQLTRTATGLKLSFDLNREGNRSIYGDFDFICTDTGQEIVLRQIRGIAVYTDINKRSLSYDINLNEAATPSCNTVKILYRGDANDPDFASQTLAEAVASL